MFPQGLGPVRRFDEIDSTNRYLVDEARAGAPNGLVAVAAYQTAGRGRLGRTWEAPPGANLLVSILVRPPKGDLAELHDCNIAVALGAADACREAAGIDPGLKWPNDLVVDGLKLAGVLSEAVPAGAAVVVGLGLNVGWPPSGKPDPGAEPPDATSIARLAAGGARAHPTTDEMLAGVLEHSARHLTDLLSVGGKERQIEEYRRRCVTLGRLVRVEEHSGSFVGTAIGISDDGYLTVETGAGRRLVTAGDVVHLRHEKSSEKSSEKGGFAAPAAPQVPFRAMGTGGAP
ncbi:MAG TPA: biotin--[acetyl-CoA-carboxylase] ligase [Acidimicrobiales bacterium]|nr:biotin--[acetyl-CoA-carboxylase] ligase [Acidimicrobiales bacterium]